jgi:hypothetical protein
LLQQQAAAVALCLHLPCSLSLSSNTNNNGSSTNNNRSNSSSSSSNDSGSGSGGWLLEVRASSSPVLRAACLGLGPLLGASLGELLSASTSLGPFGLLRLKRSLLVGLAVVAGMLVSRVAQLGLALLGVLGFVLLTRGPWH